MIKDTFEAWMLGCDQLCMRVFGISIHDCVDIRWYDLYEGGADAEEAIAELVEQDEILHDLANALET
jgi:hypothetical protein